MGATSPEALLVELGRRVARLRLDRNTTQADLAREAGVSVPTLKRLEAGRSTQTANLVRVLVALGQGERVLGLLPDPEVRPLEELEGRRRQRARPRPATDAGGERTPGWTWGDEA